MEFFATRSKYYAFIVNLVKMRVKKVFISNLARNQAVLARPVCYRNDRVLEGYSFPLHMCNDHRE